MKTETAKKLTNRTTSQESHENSKNTRKTLRVLQQTASDKENLVGRSRIDKDIKLSSESTKQKSFVDKDVQTDAVITVEDLTSEDPSRDYWRRLAEKRGEDLNRTLEENDKLKEDNKALLEENKICKSMLEESKCLVEVLQEMLQEPDARTESEEAVQDA